MDRMVFLKGLIGLLISTYASFDLSKVFGAVLNSLVSVLDQSHGSMDTQGMNLAKGPLRRSQVAAAIH